MAQLFDVVAAQSKKTEPVLSSHEPMRGAAGTHRGDQKNPTASDKKIRREFSKKGQYGDEMTAADWVKSLITIGENGRSYNDAIAPFASAFLAADADGLDVRSQVIELVQRGWYAQDSPNHDSTQGMTMAEAVVNALIRIPVDAPVRRYLPGGSLHHRASSRKTAQWQEARSCMKCHSVTPGREAPSKCATCGNDNPDAFGYQQADFAQSDLGAAQRGDALLSNHASRKTARPEPSQSDDEGESYTVTNEDGEGDGDSYSSREDARKSGEDDEDDDSEGEYADEGPWREVRRQSSHPGRVILTGSNQATDGLTPFQREYARLTGSTTIEGHR